MAVIVREAFAGWTPVVRIVQLDPVLRQQFKKEFSHWLRSQQGTDGRVPRVSFRNHHEQPTWYDVVPQDFRKMKTEHLAKGARETIAKLNLR